MKWHMAFAASLALIGAPTQAQGSFTSKIYFKQHSAEVIASGESVIDGIIKNLKNPETAVFEVAGHTDTLGDNYANGVLSMAMAYAVAAKLIRAGVKPSNIKVDGFGETRLAVQTRDNVAEPLNRRVEIRIVSQ